MTLSQAEFLRRFEQHILPRHYVKIRHTGYLRNRGKQARLAAIHEQLQLPPPMPRVRLNAAQQLLICHNVDVLKCKVCKVGRMELVRTLVCVNGQLRDAATLERKYSTTKNKGSPMRRVALSKLPSVPW